MTIEINLSQPTGEELRAARIAAGLKQKDAAALVGYSLRGWQDAEASTEPRLQAATWALFQLLTEKHETHRIEKKQ